jgi:hypothetical protein
VAIHGHVKVIFDDGERDYLAKLTVLEAKPASDGGVIMRFYRDENDDASIRFEKVVHMIKRKLH